MSKKEKKAVKKEKKAAKKLKKKLKAKAVRRPMTKMDMVRLVDKFSKKMKRKITEAWA